MNVLQANNVVAHRSVRSMRRPATRGPSSKVITDTVSLAGICNSGSGRIVTLSRIGIRFGHNRVATVVNPSNSNGSALVRYVTKLSTPSSNGIVIRNLRISSVGRGRLASLHHRRVKFVFRSFGLIPALSTRRGVLLPLRVTGHAVSHS